LQLQSQNLSGGDTSDPCRSVPGSWTQTPISAWIANVPIVPVSRNDYCPTESDLQRVWHYFRLNTTCNSCKCSKVHFWKLQYKRHNWLSWLFTILRDYKGPFIVHVL